MEMSEVMTLIGVTYTVDSIGQRKETESRKNVFCRTSSISAQEYFEAGRNGMNPQKRVSMHSYEYNDEKAVEIGGKRYGVYRTYRGKGDSIELYLERKAGA